MRIAGSSALEGAKPLAWICAALGAPPQLSLVAMTVLSEERTSVSVGFASGLEIPKAAREGPVTAIATVLLAAPPITKPLIITSLPVRTCPRVDMFDKPAVIGVPLGIAAKLAVTAFAPFIVTMQLPTPEHDP